MTRGGMAWMISTRYTAYTPSDYVLAVGLGGSVLLVLILTRWMLAQLLEPAARR